MKRGLLFFFILFIFLFPPLINIAIFGEPNRDNTFINHFELIKSVKVSSSVKNLDVSPDSEKVFVSGLLTSCVLSVPDLDFIANFSSSGAGNPISWAPDSMRVADGGSIRKAPSFRPITSLSAQFLDWKPDGGIIVSEFASVISFWNDTDYSVIKRMYNPIYTGYAWSPNGLYLAMARSPKVDIYYANNLTLMKSINVEADEATSIIASLDWSPDSTKIAYSSKEYFIQVLDFANGTVIQKLYGFTNRVISFDWADDGHHLIASSADETVNLYDVHDGSYDLFTLKLGGIGTGIEFLSGFQEFVVGISSSKVEHWRFHEDVLIANAGPDIRGIVKVPISFKGSASVGEIPDDGFTWSIDLGPAGIKNLTGRSVSYTFEEAGTYEVRLRVRDIYGREAEDTTLVSVFIASQKPTVTLDSPESSSEISGTITVRGTASDDVGVRKVEVVIGDGSWMPAKGTEAWTFEIDTRTLKRGGCEIGARAFDDAQVSNTTWITVFVVRDLQPPPGDKPPTITILTPEEGATVSGTLYLSGTASDDTYVDYVYVTFPTFSTHAIGGAYWFMEMDTTKLVDGPYTILAEAVDEFGQRSSARVTVYFENYPDDSTDGPNVGITTPINGSNVEGDILITGWANDDVAVRIVQVQLGDSLWHTCTGLEDWNLSVNTSEHTNGPLEVRARAFDGYLFSEVVQVTVNVSNEGGNNNGNGSGDGDGGRPPTAVDKNCIFPVILVLALILTFVVTMRDVKHKKLWAIIIVALLVCLIVLIPFLGEQEEKEPPHVPNGNNNGNGNQTNNTTLHYAPDFTFRSLRDDGIVSNEMMLGNVTLILFSGFVYRDPAFENLNQLYKDILSRGYANFKVIGFNNETIIPDKSLYDYAVGFCNGVPSWDFAVDRWGIYERYTGGMGPGIYYFLINKDGELTRPGNASYPSYSVIEGLLKEPYEGP